MGSNISGMMGESSARNGTQVGPLARSNLPPEIDRARGPGLGVTATTERSASRRNPGLENAAFEGGSLSDPLSAPRWRYRFGSLPANRGAARDFRPTSDMVFVHELALTTVWQHNGPVRHFVRCPEYAEVERTVAETERDAQPVCSVRWGARERGKRETDHPSALRDFAFVSKRPQYLVDELLVLA